jgi:hypothetical protein
MKQLETRLTELEARRTGEGSTVEHMTDRELIAIVTGDRSAVISDAELERIIATQALDNQGSRSEQAI